MPAYGKREDGTPKEIGYFGEVASPHGPMTELSIEVDGRLMPSIVPTLSRKELAHLASGADITDPIADKAVAHAQGRVAQGRSPFAGDSEPATYNKQLMRQMQQARELRGM